MDSKHIFCLRERHMSMNNIIVESEKINPKTIKVVKVRKEKCDICGRGINHNFLLC